ncbi:MAG: response regulator transcription factor [Bacteroidales bacterium]|nr:response regulator transcription factor [Bacteroidales bacterium]
MMENKRILLAEDDMNLGKVLTTVLTGKGFDVKHANNGEAAYELFCTNEFDLCLIDVMMPIKDGFTLAQEIRKMDKRIPIIFLTAKTMQEDMIKGLSIGGDDYITKPFTMEILLARIQALLRRTEAQEDEGDQIVNIGNIQFDRKRHVLIINGEEQKMTSREGALLDMLYEQRNDVLYRSYALKKIWGEDSFYNSRNMDVYITRLRKLLKSEPNVQIVNVHSTGFKLIW